MFAVGTLAEQLSVEEEFDPNVRIVGHEQPALDARFLDATELRQRCSIEPGKPAPTMITSNLSADMSALTGAQEMALLVKVRLRSEGSRYSFPASTGNPQMTPDAARIFERFLPPRKADVEGRN